MNEPWNLLQPGQDAIAQFSSSEASPMISRAGARLFTAQGLVSIVGKGAGRPLFV